MSTVYSFLSKHHKSSSFFFKVSGCGFAWAPESVCLKILDGTTTRFSYWWRSIVLFLISLIYMCDVSEKFAGLWKTEEKVSVENLTQKFMIGTLYTFFAYYYCSRSMNAAYIMQMLNQLLLLENRYITGLLEQI